MNLNKQLVNKEDLLNDVSDLDIYRCYCPELEIELGKRVLSPLREESNPSFGLFVGDDNQILFNDFLLGGGDCIKFVQLLYNESFFDAMSRIVVDFKLQDKYHHKDVVSKNIPPNKSLNKEELISKAGSSLIRKKSREWALRDANFWKPFGVTLRILRKYNVEPIDYVFINDKIIGCDDHTYCFIERKDDIETYKIYQPFNKKYKWLNNHNESVWQGWEQLPDTGETLIITKSLKDVMVIEALTGIPAVSLQAESVKPKDHIIEELKARFDNIFIWYDNDFDSETNWGREFGATLATEFNLIQIEIPDAFRIKDISDFAKIRGKEQAINLVKKLIELPF